MGGQYVLVANSDLGPCRGSTIDSIPGSGPCTINYMDYGEGIQAKHIVYDHLYIHDYSYAPSCIAAGDCHYRPVYMNGIDDVTIRNSTFARNVFEPWFTHLRARRRPGPGTTTS